MGFGLTRFDLQRLAAAKLEDAELLLVHRRFANSYYLAGYAAEIALKACIAKQFAAEVIPDKSFVNQLHTHAIKTLVGLAGLSSKLKSREDSDIAFAANFAIVAQWGPDVRYEAKDSMSAQTMMVALNDPQSGIFPWIKLYW